MWRWKLHMVVIIKCEISNALLLFLNFWKILLWMQNRNKQKYHYFDLILNISSKCLCILKVSIFQMCCALGVMHLLNLFLFSLWQSITIKLMSIILECLLFFYLPFKWRRISLSCEIMLYVVCRCHDNVSSVLNYLFSSK